MKPFVVEARNVSHALRDAIVLMNEHGIDSPSRAGDVKVLPGPLVTILQRPTERVLTWPIRDANPYFHLMEALWMLAGKQDVAWPTFFVKRMEEFSDDGVIFHSAYGYRWRKFFGEDQLQSVVQMFRKDPTTRRAVIQMWSAPHDLAADSKDLPCNISLVPEIRDGNLNLHVMNRSNDMIWGLYGANAVHFSVLQEWLAAQIGVNVGVMSTYSVNAHIYKNVPKYAELMRLEGWDDYYVTQENPLYNPIVNTFLEDWEQDNRNLLKFRLSGFVDPFFDNTAAPMLGSWRLYKNGQLTDALEKAWEIVAIDWRTACVQWMERRIERRERNQK